MAIIQEALERKVIITGGTGATGLPTVIEFARYGLTPLVVIRPIDKTVEDPNNNGKKIKITSEERVTRFQSIVEDQTGIKPLVAKGDLAEIDTPEKAGLVVDGFGLAPHEPVHYAPIAAEGINAYKLSLAKDLRELRMGFASGRVTVDMLQRATDKVKQNYTTPERMRLAMQSNRIAHTLILDQLIERGHLGEDSVVGMMASSFSADVDVARAKYIYDGPGFYWPIAFSKAMQAEDVRRRVGKHKFKGMEFVAPEISDTPVGEFLEEFGTWITAAFPDQPPVIIPSAMTDTVAKLFVAQFVETIRHEERFTRQFMADNETVTDFRPKNWPERVLRGYL